MWTTFDQVRAVSVLELFGMPTLPTSLLLAMQAVFVGVYTLLLNVVSMLAIGQSLLEWMKHRSVHVEIF